MTKPTLYVEEIKQLIPHRFPMLLIDRLTEIEPNKAAVGIKNVTTNEHFFEGHFPGNPIMPGVLTVEAMAQSAGALVMYSLDIEDKSSQAVYFMSIDDVRFRKPVVPGDTLKLHVEAIQNRGPVWKFSGKAYVEDVLVCQATFKAMIAPK